MNLKFNAQDPYPLIDSTVTYQEQQAHSAKVDQWLGLNEKVEEELANRLPNFGSALGEQHWIGLPLQTLQTPYTEIRSLLALLNLKEGDHVVDLGAGYGRMGLVIDRLFPGVKFTGYEVVAERVAEGSRLISKLENPLIELIVADLSVEGFKPVEAEFYFLYDFGSREAIAKTLNDLREISMRRKITVVGRGRSSRDAIERGEPWLSQVNEPRHFEHFSIYRS